MSIRDVAGWTGSMIGHLLERAKVAEAENATLKATLARVEALVLMGEKVVEDFMPNIGRCALQDYGRLNDFLIQVKALKGGSEK